MPSLQYVLPNGAEASYELHKRVTSIGSSEDNDIVLVDRAVAETHAFVRFDGRRFSVQSMVPDGLVHAGRRKDGSELQHGDEFHVGGCRLRFLLHAEVSSPSQAPSAVAETYRQILEISRKLMMPNDIHHLLDELMDGILALTRADKGFLILSEGDELVVKVSRFPGGHTPSGELQPWSDSIVTNVLESRKPIIVADALNDRVFGSSHSVVSLKVCSVMCVPMLVGEQLQGLIYVGNDNVVNLFTELHLEALTIFGAQAALIIARALALNELQVDNQRLRERIENMRFGSLIGSCDAMRAVYRKVEKVSATDVSVLITGETGTGKELIAREIHNRSERRKGPFVTINCGAIPENLLESELFGHARGAFTGATVARSGKFQAADGGTLFLDEIGEMPLPLQVKILRALQERMVTRVGESRPEKVDIRIVAATHRNLPQMIVTHEFREDLYYRLNVVTLLLPALRDRGDDVVVIARYLLERYREEYRTGPRNFSREAVAAIRRYSWPGNIRQLENHIKKAVILSDSASIRPEDLELPTDQAAEVKPLAEAREDWQRQYITDVLALNNGNRTKTARDLGVDPRTVFRFLEKEGDKPDGV
jgi:transcriptional regulator with GAF, ATPase, and Fis domain